MKVSKKNSKSVFVFGLSATLIAMTSFSAFAEIEPEDLSKDVIIGKPFYITDLGSLPEIQETSEKKCLDLNGEVQKSGNKYPGSSSYTCYNGVCGERITWEVQCLVQQRTSMPLFAIYFDANYNFGKQKAFLLHSTLNPRVENIIKNWPYPIYQDNLKQFIELKKDPEIIKLKEELTSLIGPFTIVIHLGWDIDEIALVNSSYQSLGIDFHKLTDKRIKTLKSEDVIEMLKMGIQSKTKEDPFSE